MRQILTLMCLALLAPHLAAAEPVSGKDARRMLFSDRGTEVVLNASAELSETDRKTIDTLVRSNGFKYYGAIAFSPSQGLLSESLQGAFNYHDPGAAAAAALRACEAARLAGASPCVVAAQVMPRRWSAQPLQLSQDATAAFQDYRRDRGEKAIAVSYGSGGFGIGTGAGAEAAALASCNAASSTGDCVIVVRD